MSNEAFTEHLAYLAQLEPLDRAALYQALASKGPWPRCNDEPISPLALILNATSHLIQRLAPESAIGEHPEQHVVANCVGILLYQLGAISTIAGVAALPTMIEGESAALQGEGMRRVGIDVARILSLDYGVPSNLLIMVDGESNGEETEAAESKD